MTRMCSVATRGVVVCGAMVCSGGLAAAQPSGATVTAMPTLVAEQFVESGLVGIGPGQVAWFSLQVNQSISATLRRGLDVDTEGSLTSLLPTASDLQDTDIALFNNAGQMVAIDAQDGSWLQGMLSFGTPSPVIVRPAPGDGQPYDGRDGDLAAGTYYVAVSTGGLTTDPLVAFGVDAGSFVAGAIRLRARFVSNTGGPPTTFATVPFVTEAWGTATAPLASGGVAWFACTIPSLAVHSALDVDTDGSMLTPVNDTSIALYSSTGTSQWADNDDGTGLLSALSFGVGRNSSPPNDGGSFTASGTRFDGRDATTGFLQGPRTLYFAVTGANIQRGSPTMTREVYRNGWVVTPPAVTNSGTVQLRIRYRPPPVANELPPATPLALTADGVWRSATGFARETDAAWFSVVLPSLEATGAVDFDTVGSDVTPVNAVGLMVFGSSGGVLVTDTASGPGWLGLASFGSGRRAAVGDGRRYAGQSGPVAGGGMVSGATMYVALLPGRGRLGDVSGNQSLGSIGISRFGAFTPNGEEIGAGPVTLRARAWTRNAPSDPPVPPVATANFGRIGRTPSQTEAVYSVTAPLTEAIRVVNWYTFTIQRSAAGETYVDIDTEGTAPEDGTQPGGIADTRLALYDPRGVILHQDTGDGVGARPALSFGSTLVRPNVGTGGLETDQPRNGRDGPLAPGQYWIGLGSESSSGMTFMVDFQTSAAGSAVAIPGPRVLNIRTNIPLPTCASAADIAGANQSAVPDDALTADDIIVFLGRYFAGDARSDVAGANQVSGGDGALTADDIIWFLGAYFGGC